MAEQTQRTCEDCGCKFQAGPWAHWCPVCRPLHQGRDCKYKLTDEIARLLKDRYDSNVRGRAAEIGAQIGWPTWQVQRVAVKLGLSRPWPPDRRAWTDDEIEYLRTWAGLRSAAWIGRQIGRRESSVMLKLKRLRLSRQVRGGYSQRHLAQCFGCDDHVVGRWIKRGLLKANMEGPPRPNEMRRASEPAILEFIRTHRQEYRLDKVNQPWFLDLVLGPNGQDDNRRREGGRPAYAPTAQEIDERADDLRTSLRNALAKVYDLRSELAAAAKGSDQERPSGWVDDDDVVEPEEMPNGERRMQIDECLDLLTVTPDP